MSNDIQSQLGGLSHFLDRSLTEEVPKPLSPEVFPPENPEGASDQASEVAKASSQAAPAEGASLQDVLNDPASMAHSFMQKAQACRDSGDLAGYFAYHDHAMTWAQTELSARNG